MAMLIQTTKKNIGNMFVNYNTNRQIGNMLIFRDKIEAQLPPVLPTLPPNLDLIIHFDAKTVLPSDIDSDTLNLLRATNHATQTPFEIMGESTSSQAPIDSLYTARFQEGGLTNRYGFLIHKLDQSLQLSYPTDHIYTSYNVFGLNTNIEIWENIYDYVNGTIINTCAQKNSGYSWVFSLQSLQYSKQILVVANRRRYYFNLPPSPSIHNDILTRLDSQRYIVKFEYSYTEATTEHVISLLLTTITGEIIINETQSFIGPWEVSYRTDKWITVAGYENHRNHSKLNINSSILSTKQFTEDEHNKTMTYLMEKWKS